MGKLDMDLFINDNFRVLYLLYINQTKINNTFVCPMTQQEIGEELGFCLMKVNSIMITLQQEGYIEKYRNSRGRYILSNKAKKVIAALYK